MAKKRIVKCISCGVFNENRDMCHNCGAILSHRKRREIKIREEAKKRIEYLKENLQKHRFLPTVF